MATHHTHHKKKTAEHAPEEEPAEESATQENGYQMTSTERAEIGAEEFWRLKLIS